MFVKISILALLAIVHSASSQCGLPGPCTCAQISNPFCEEEEVVYKPHGPLVVRPQPLPKVVLSPTSTLGQSAGGPCAYKKAIATPAISSRPVYRPAISKQGLCETASAIASAATALCRQSKEFSYQHRAESAAREVLGEPLLLDAVINSQKVERNCAPADAVSLAMAYKQAMEQQRIISEDRLAYGFKKLPIELPKVRKIAKPEVLEENLYSLNGQIVELKPVPPPCNKKTLAEEAEEALMNISEEEAASEDRHLLRKVSLGELGYTPVRVSKNTFIDVPLANPVEAAAEAALDLTQGCTCQDGFQAGSVMYTTIPKEEKILNKPYDRVCDASDEADKPLPLVPCNCPGNTGGISLPHSGYYSHSSSSSSCKKSSSCNHRVFLDKLC